MLGFEPNDKSILVYDQSVDVSYGLWVCPQCKSAFYGGGHAVHEKGCTFSGYDGLEFHFGDKHIEEARKVARKFSKDHAWHGISIALLEEKMPQVLV